VVVGGAPATNASRLVAPDEAVAVLAPPSRYVGRGGDKLAAALDGFGLSLAGARVLDAGSSTGGFTDCSLQAGAASVVAVDVGRGQLHQRLRTDPRVEVHERTNVRHLTPGDLGPLADVVVADLSFISLRAVADALFGLARPGADLIWLVKPQFEARRDEVSSTRGVITDPEVWQRVLSTVCGALGQRGAAIMGLMTSPLRGADGNVEFLLHARAPGHGRPADDQRVEALVDAAVGEARS
jgi:23S rRNA (cytidine1920-2'-O)/16S rRNA (cytidine1409-2'-O)-methyltransferase